MEVGVGIGKTLLPLGCYNHLLIVLTYAHFLNLKAKRFSVKDCPKECLESLIFKTKKKSEIFPICLVYQQCVDTLLGLSLMAHSPKTPFQLSTIPTAGPKGTLPSPDTFLLPAWFFHWFLDLSPFRSNWLIRCPEHSGLHFSSILNIFPIFPGSWI